MILDNHVVVDAPPDEVFALLNDVERVAGCLPGAKLDGGDGETYTGGVKVRVGPISAAYAGNVRFLETDKDRRYLRLQARGTDTKGSGDAEAQVELTVEESGSGSILRLRTDLLIRGKIAQFGKGAIGAVSAKLLGQFAVNLAGLLQEDRTGVKPLARTTPPQELDGLALLVPPSARKYVPVVAAFAFGLFEGWLLGKLRAQSKQLKQVRRG